ncbi:ABC transporter permease [Aliivibrio kagoshimensis]|uniref:ABC transporter permease n=1 Tax=Aliivibrio kagoshimensis TaxID=2910230 RepID=UPI003D148478
MRQARSALFTALVIVALILCFLPLLPGLGGLIVSAFGYIPAINQTHLSLSGFVDLWQWPGLMNSIGLTLFIAIGSTFFATILCFSILQSCWGSRWWKKVESLIAPLLALPHVAFAIGFAFLFTPSGFFARVFSHISTDFTISSWSVINDNYGIGLIIGLIIKEIPFLLFMSLPILKQLNIRRTLFTARSLGYSSHQAWQKIIFVQWLPKMRFPLLAVIAYSASVVDMSLVIGPKIPPTLSVLIWQWWNDADLLTLGKATSGAFLLFVLCAMLLLLIRFVEWMVTQYARSWQISGRYALPLPGRAALLLTASISLLTIPVLMVWSVALRWQFPNISPSRWSSQFWGQEWSYLIDIINNSVFIALLSSSIALLCALLVHEHSTRTQRRWTVPRFLVSVPMLAPQISLLFGIQVLSIFAGSDHYIIWVVWTHLFFAFPYIYIALDGPWRSYDQRLDNTARSLGLNALQVWYKIKMPTLFPAIVIAWVVGISVSLAQYLPTLMLGAGRIPTLTTEAIALSSGQDRRVSAIYALLQFAVPVFFYVFAIILSRVTGPLENRTSLRNKGNNDVNC